MIKTWRITCEVNMCTNRKVISIVKSNTERKAKIMAEKQLHKDGYFHVNIISCNEVKENDNNRL